jgi:hypothetical protein
VGGAAGLLELPVVTGLASVLEDPGVGEKVPGKDNEEE